MRLLTKRESEREARQIGDVLYAEGVGAEVQQAGDGRWSVWVHLDSQLELARQLLDELEANPNSERVRAGAAQAKRMRKHQERENKRSRYREVDVRTSWKVGPRRGPLTLALVVTSVVLTAVNALLPTAIVEHYMLIDTRPLWTGAFARVLSGEVWRLVTPIFLHGGHNAQAIFLLMHLFFNMAWLLDLGGLLEAKKGTVYLAVFVLVSAVLPNVAQYVWTHSPRFLGMSGVVYALLGFVWMRGRFDPASGMQLRAGIVQFMLIWLVLGYLEVLPMANVVHTVGLGVGVAWGYLSSGHLRRRLRR